METASIPVPDPFIDKFWAYLQGMETIPPEKRWWFSSGFEPTYKEWKRFPGILADTWLTGFEPTYKEWKLLAYLYILTIPPKFWAYLQGMETLSSFTSLVAM